MQSKKIELSDDDMKKLSDLEASLQHWSLRHTEAALKLDGLLQQIRILNDSRQKMLSELLESNNVDPSSVVKMSIEPSLKTIEVLVEDSQPE